MTGISPPNIMSDGPLEYIKNPMVAEFMGFHRDTNYSESELEQALIDERPAAELDNARMVEMRVGCKVHPSSLNL